MAKTWPGVSVERYLLIKQRSDKWRGIGTPTRVQRSIALSEILFFSLFLSLNSVAPLRSVSLSLCFASREPPRIREATGKWNDKSFDCRTSIIVPRRRRSVVDKPGEQTSSDPTCYRLHVIGPRPISARWKYCPAALGHVYNVTPSIATHGKHSVKLLLRNSSREFEPKTRAFERCDVFRPFSTLEGVGWIIELY